jgi:D-alanine-D-alanine ligase
MRKLRVLVLFDTDYDPPIDQDYRRHMREIDEVEFDVTRALKRGGYEVRWLGFKESLRPLAEALMDTNVDVVFNLVERFQGDSRLDAAVAGLLELSGLPYTGATQGGLVLARDKAKSKSVLAREGVPVPRFFVCRRGWHVPRCDIPFPVIVKPLDEDASVGVTQGAVVRSQKSLERRVLWVHERFDTDAIVEQFIVGREIYVSVMGNERLEVLPAVEMVFRKQPDPTARFATFRAKWDWDYRERLGIENRLTGRLAGPVAERVQDVAARSYRATGMRDYARIDIRLSEDGVPYVLEVNPNPFIAWGEDLWRAAKSAGYKYDDLIDRIVNMAWARRDVGRRRI